MQANIADADLDFAEALDEIGESLTVGTAEMLCIAGDMDTAYDYVEGGFYDGADVVVSVRKSDFASEPSKGTACTYQGRSLKILRVRPGLATYDLILGEMKTT